MMNPSKQTLLQSYAAGEVSWSELRGKGFDDYAAVLAGLGELGLRPPIAPMSGPNVAARERGRTQLARLLEAVPRR